MESVILPQITSMEALSWKTAISRRAAIVEANLKELCNCNSLNVPSQLEIRCLQDSSQQPSQPHPKFSSTTSPFLRIFSLNRSIEEKVGEGTKVDSRAFMNEVSQSSPNRFDGSDQILLSLGGVPEGQQRIGKSDAEGNSGAERSNTKISSPGNHADSMERFFNGEASYLPLNNPKFEMPEAKEVCVDASHISSNAENKHVKPDQSKQENRSNWVPKIMDLRSYFKYENSQCSSVSDSNSVPPDGSISSTTSNGCFSEIFVNNCDCEHSGHRCNCNDDDFLCSVMEEFPVTEETFDRESFSRFLHRVSLPETKLFSQLLFLCALAYKIPEIKPRDLWKLYRLRFFTSSLHEKAKASAKVGESISNKESSSTSVSCGKGGDCNVKNDPNHRFSASPTVAYEIAASAASYLHSQTKQILPFKQMNNVQANTDGKPSGEHREDATSENNQLNGDAQKDIENTLVDQRIEDCDNQKTFTELQQADFSRTSGISESEMAAIVATSSVTVLVAANEEEKQAAAKDLQSSHSSPCEWFVCDDHRSHTRHFIIQGSESLASWQANLFFEPTRFEGFEVLVHRGIYEAAKGMYEQFLPMVLSHLKTHGEDARFRFTGHSLGGSLSVLLNLMLLIRGVVPMSSLLPVTTFGSPCIMCGGDQLLRKLGLPKSHIQAVMMHRDVVPRAFACNYPDHVAEVLKRLNSSFRNHPCLNFQKLLYGTMGQLLILQPDEKVSPPHPLLPSGSGLYILHCVEQSGCKFEAEAPRTVQVQAAERAFLNSPHPLETLSDPGAYGSQGSISRDHDAVNYLRAINFVLRQQTKHLRRLQREQRRQIWWPLVSTDSSMSSHRPSKVDIQRERKMSEDATSLH